MSKIVVECQTIHMGDSTAVLSSVPSESVQLVVTSPPYWTLKDYENDGQIGISDSYEGYLSRMDEVWGECIRALESGCKIAINIGDQFLRAKDHGAYSVAPIHADIIKQMTDRGLLYLGGIIWRKITNTTTTGGCAWMGSIYHPRDGYVTYEHEFILLFKKEGKARRPPKDELDKSVLTKEQRSEWFRGVWDIPPSRQKGHPAMFPVALPERLIRMFTFHGETVLDPFVGSGSTLVAAKNSGRRGVGIELNEEYARMCVNRLSTTSLF